MDFWNDNTTFVTQIKWKNELEKKYHNNFNK